MKDAQVLMNQKRSDKSLHQDGIFYPVFFNFLFQTTHINHKKDPHTKI